MVHTSSVILAATAAFFAVGTALALPIAERSISTRENIDDLESRFIGAIIGAAVRIGTKAGAKAGAKHEAHKHAGHHRHRRDVDDVDELPARDIDDSELAARDFDNNEIEVYGRDLEFDELD